MPEFSSAGTTLKINSLVISGCYSTPDMGGDPEMIDISSFDQKKYKKKLQGLMELPALNFDFFDSTDNYNAALDAESNTPQQYSLTYPDGSGYKWQGTHKTYKLSAAVGDAIKFRITCAANDELEDVKGTGVTAE